MNLYYQNGTLYVDILTILDDEVLESLKTKLFGIIDDYGINNIILSNTNHTRINHKYLSSLRREYLNKYNGRIFIR